MPLAAVLLLGATIAPVRLGLAPSSVASLNEYTVLNNTDFPDNCDGGGKRAYSAGTSAIDCAKQCAKRHDCAASIFNSNKQSTPGMECCFKCRADNPIANVPGIEAVIVQPHRNTCGRPPPPPAPPPPPPPIPADWQAGFAEGSLVVSGSTPKHTDQAAVLHDSVPLGNGLVGTVVDLENVYLGGVYNTFVSLDAKGFVGWRRNSSARASIPATTSSIALAAPANISALDVRHGVYLARWHGLAGGCLAAERRTFAPRVDAPMLVTRECMC